VKRANGEGSITRRKDGRWQISVIDPLTGKRRTTYAGKDASEKAARDALRAMLSRVDTGLPVVDAGTTLSAYADEWLRVRAGRRRRPATVNEYAWRLHKYVLPRIGGLRLRELTVPVVEDLLDELAGAKLSKATVVAIRNALAALLSDALKARHVTVNVARLAQLPESMPGNPARARAGIPTTAEVQALLAKCAGHELEPLVLLLVGTGARIGEALAMTWDDLDLDAARWSVRRTVTRTEVGAAVLGDRTKTGQVRTLYLPPEVVVSLRKQRARVARQQVASAHWVEVGLVFPTSIGTVQDPHNARRDFKVLAKSAGFPGSFHGLRHHFASVAVGQAPDVSVAKVLGHRKTSTTTDLYAHLRDSDAERIGVAVNVAVNSKGK
jgi:integrase